MKRVVQKGVANVRILRNTDHESTERKEKYRKGPYDRREYFNRKGLHSLESSHS